MSLRGSGVGPRGRLRSEGGRGRMRGALLVALVALACGGGDGPSEPEAPDADGYMTARIDGSAWRSDAIYVNAGAVATGAGIIAIQGTRVSGSDALAISISLMNVPRPGTYPLGTAAAVAGGSAAIAQSESGQPPDAWNTPLSGAAGTITIASISDTRITGTFEFKAEAVSGSASGERAVTEGRFDLPLQRTGSAQPVAPQSMNRISATIDGAPWHAASVALQQNVSNLWGFAASNTSYMVTIGVQDFDGPGTYTLSSTLPLRLADVYGPGGVLDTSTHCCWTSTGPGATGSITVETQTDTRIAGTFSFTLAAKSGTVASEPITVMNGEFDVGIPE